MAFVIFSSLPSDDFADDDLKVALTGCQQNRSDLFKISDLFQDTPISYRAMSIFVVSRCQVTAANGTSG